MKFKFLKTAAILSLGLSLSLVSCDKNEIENENEGGKTAEQQSKTLSPFEEVVDVLSKDTNVVDFSVVNPSDMFKDSLLRRESDRLWYYDRENKYLCDLVGIESSSGNPTNKIKIGDMSYSLIDVDLNMGAGGKYVYLYAAFADGDHQRNPRPQAITKINVSYSSLPSSGTIVKKLGGGSLNCNAGTKKGAAIYLSVEKENYSKDISRIRGIMVAAYKSSSNSVIKNPVTGTWNGLSPHMDLNKGAGGRYIYLFTLQ
ncbi:MAG: hypothetical protein J5554_06760 [Paludibacteraceae bacterium]|nr:hypothetical protein [Paludibacteraceae bacterium]